MKYELSSINDNVLEHIIIPWQSSEIIDIASYLFLNFFRRVIVTDVCLTLN